MLGEDRYIEIRSEDLHCAPIEGLNPLLPFVGLPPTHGPILRKLVTNGRAARESLKTVDEVVERAKGGKIFRDLGYDRRELAQNRMKSRVGVT